MVAAVMVAGHGHLRHDELATRGAKNSTTLTTIITTAAVTITITVSSPMNGTKPLSPSCPTPSHTHMHMYTHTHLQPLWYIPPPPTHLTWVHNTPGCCQPPHFPVPRPARGTAWSPGNGSGMCGVLRARTSQLGGKCCAKLQNRGFQAHDDI